jgi:hypothetical protein
MEEGTCPICEGPAQRGPGISDDEIIICSHCDGYRLSGTASHLLREGRLRRPDREEFRKLVQRKRGDSTEYPLITQYDLE